MNVIAAKLQSFWKRVDDESGGPVPVRDWVSSGARLLAASRPCSDSTDGAPTRRW